LPAAIEHLERAAKASPAKSYVHYQLGRAYLKAGRQQDADREFAKVKALQGTGM
jgi:Flp pilus assembly protein TadD